MNNDRPTPPTNIRIIQINSRVNFLMGVCALILSFTIAPTAAHEVTRAEVVAGAEQLYQARIEAMQRKFQLDNDDVFLARVRHIAQTLIAQASREHPDSATFKWEIHSTDDHDENASCMAGGKLLIGQNYVLNLELNDAELAMMLSHEIQHALLEHNFKEFQEAQRVAPEWKNRSFLELENALDDDDTLMSQLSEFDKTQENEADAEGLKMAWRAGWPALKLADYYKKLARADAMANFSSREHPASAQRWQAARTLAEQLNKLSR